MFKFIRRYAYRFITSASYRSYVFQLLRERSAPTMAADEFHLSKSNDFSDLRGSRVFMCGGCELTFIGDHFRTVGLDVYHTFDNGRTSEPMIEVNDPNSEIFTMRPDFAVFSQAQAFMQLLKKTFADGTNYNEQEKNGDFAALLNHLRLAIERVNGAMDCPIFLISHFLITGKYRGTHEYKTFVGSTSYEEMNLKYTLALYEIAKNYKSIYLLDVNEILEVEGKKRTLEYEGRSGIFDHPTKFGARLIAEEALFQFKVLNPKSRRVKCAIFDLDNTLWRGVLREDGAGNVYPKWSHLHVMRALAARGILLCVCSKNDPEEEAQVEQILGKELYDLLVSVKLNWKPKSENIKQIARELNIGLDAIAFFDDSPFEREEVQTNVGGAVVFEDTQIMAALDMVLFEPIGLITEESAARTQMYKEQARRAAAESTADPSNIGEYYKSCQFVLEIERPDVAMTVRIEELIQRTNQLNATGNRTTQSELAQYLNNQSKYYVSAASLRDKFGDYGLIGVCIAQRLESKWEIIEFDFSCRAMGKHVEHAMLTHLCQTMHHEEGEAITIRFKRTSRNKEMESILRNFGFNVSWETEDLVELHLPVGRESYCYPEWFEIIQHSSKPKVASPLVSALR